MNKHHANERIVVVERQSQAVSAVVNFLFPSFGYLIQGRLLAFLSFWVLAVIAGVIGIATAGVGLLLLPILWIISIVDAAKYRPKR